MKTKAKIEFSFVDVTAKSDSTLDVSEKQDFVNLEDLRSDEIEETKYGTLEKNQFALDGSFSLLPDTELTEMGLWSNQMSDKEGNFATPLTLEIVFSEVHSSLGLTFIFSKAGDYCNNLNLKFYDEEGNLLSDKDFEPDSYKYVCNDIVENYAKIIVTFYSTNNPYRYLKLYKILYGAEQTFEGENLHDANILEEVDLLSSEISINTLDFIIYSENDDFNILNPKGVYSLLQERQPIKASEIFTKENKTIDMGTFYLDTWKNKTDKKMEISAIDLVGIIDKTDFNGGIYINAKAGEILESIFASAGLDSDDYEIQEDLYNVLLTGYIPICTHREALQQVVFALGAVADCSRSEKIKIYTVVDSDTPSTIEKTDVFQGTREIEQNEIVTGVSIVAHNYVKGTETENLYEGTLDAGETTIQFNDPVSDITCTGGTIVEYNCNYAIISCEEESDVSITGYKYGDNLQTFLVEIDGLSSSDTRNTLKIEEAYLISKSNAKDIATKILNYYQKTYKTNFEFILSNETLTEDIEVEGDYDKKLVGHVTKLDIDLTGGFIAKTSMNARVKEDDDG